MGQRARSLPVAAVVALVLSATLLGPAAAAPSPDGPPSGASPARTASADAVGDEVIVRWAGGAHPAARADARGDHGIAHAQSMRRTGVELHTITSGRDPADVALELTGDPRVEYAQPNYRLRPHTTAPDDPLFDELWGLRNTGQSIRGVLGLAGIDVGALEAWEETRAEGVVVAVIDSGIDRDHPDLNPNMWVNPDPGSDPRYPEDLHGWDFRNHDNTVFDPEDGGHGTHVAGTLGAVADNGVGIAGVAPEATIMPLKFLGPNDGSTADAILAIEYAAQRGVRVANASWGGPASSDNVALEEAIAAASGMVFVTSAGNRSRNVDSAPFYPCSFDLPNIMCVAALDNHGALAVYSNFGVRTVDLGAPGSDVLSTVPHDPDTSVALQTAYDFRSGTSMASPYVAGVAALVAAVGPDLAAPEIVDLVTQTVLPLPSLEGVTTSGGMVSAARAVAAASGGTAAGPPSAPRDVAAEAGVGTTTVTWSAPILAGGSPVDEYIVTAEPGAATTTVGGDAREASVTGLDGGQTYTFTVRAANAEGLGPPSAASEPITPRGLPGPPTAVIAVAGVGSANVTWTAPTDDGGSPITGYTVTAAPGGETTTVEGDTREATVTGLVGGQTYTFTVRAANASGSGPPSDPSAPVVPRGAPGAPTSVVAVAGHAEAAVTWSAPADDGGSPVTAYTVTAAPGGATTTVAGDARAATVTGLADGQAYTFTVRATNAHGSGAASAPSNAVIPQAPAACPPGTVPGAGFTDVPDSNVHAAAIDCATWYGLAQGTGPTTYGPGASVRRDQMAAFIGRLVAEAGVDIAPAGAPFDDVAGNVHAPHINALAAAGIVEGVAPGTYAPGSLVTRDQMAAFLTRTYEFIAQQTLPAPSHGFTDVSGTVHATAIAKAAGADFARGLTDSAYGPRQRVRRDQMASFLTRVLQRLIEDGLAAARP